MNKCMAWVLLGPAVGLAPCAVAVAGDLQVETALLKAEMLGDDLVQGRLLKIESEYLLIEGQNGEQFRVHVDEHTSFEPVRTGDTVSAYMTDTGHVTTIHRLEPQHPASTGR